MSTIDLNAELLRQINQIADDETLMRKAVRYMKRLVAAHQTEVEATEYIDKEEILEGIRQGLMEVKEARRSGKKQKTLQEVIDEL